jgi:molecular chaperone DnaK (HSP70)
MTWALDLGTTNTCVATWDEARGHLQERKDADKRLRSAARQAVARIQSRRVGASPGQLSLASDEAGQLSLADEDPKGQLSLPEPPPTE